MKPKIDLSKIDAKLLETLKSNGLAGIADFVEREKIFTSNHVNEALDKFHTQDLAMIAMKERAKFVADEADPVLIIGDTGTGKELIAQALHGSRKGHFVPVNCAGLPETLMEAEMFGHVVGAFTGANRDKKGLMEEATNGTIFLDEIGELPLSLQSKLLRAIQERKIRKVGGVTEIPITCRFVFATHRDLHTLTEKGEFRKDLFYRISTIVLKISALHERPKDIPYIIQAICNPESICCSVDELISEIAQLDSKLPGNVRSLEQYIRRKELFDTIE